VLTPDFRDLLSAFIDANVEFLVGRRGDITVIEQRRIRDGCA